MHNYAYCTGFIDKNEWTQTFEYLGHHVLRTMLEKNHYLQPKPKTTEELKVALQTIWEKLPQEHINTVVANFIKCLTAYNGRGCQ